MYFDGFFVNVFLWSISFWVDFCPHASLSYPGKKKCPIWIFFHDKKKSGHPKTGCPFTQTHPSNPNLSPGPTRFFFSTNDFPKVGGSIDLRKSSRWGLGVKSWEMGDGSYIPPIWRIYWCLYLICSSWGFSIPMGRGFYTHDSDFLLAATSWRCWR